MIPHRVPRHRPPVRPLSRLGVPLPIDGANALPADAVRVLRLVAAEMRDMPRDCATDRRELVHWLSRLARRLDDLAASKARPAAVAPPPSLPTPKPAPGAAAAAPDVLSAEVDRSAEVPTPRLRLVRRGPPWRAVPIAAAARRRVEAAGQLDLFR